MDFSVIISVYKNDRASHFNAALESIFSQSSKPSEVILVVDGSITEDIERIIQQHLEIHANFSILRLASNAGLGNARRIGLENCSHDLVAVMDSDDISLTNRFEQQLNCFSKDPTLSVVGGQILEFIDSIENTINLREVPLNDSDIKSFLKFRNPINHMTVMFKKSDVMKAGNYQDFYLYEDYFLWIRMYLNGAKFMNINKPLVYARIGTNMFARRGGLRYFLSGLNLQTFMLRNGIIGFGRFTINVASRFIGHILIPGNLRSILYRIFLRKRPAHSASNLH